MPNQGRIPRRPRTAASGRRPTTLRRCGRRRCPTLRHSQAARSRARFLLDQARFGRPQSRARRGVRPSSPPRRRRRPLSTSTNRGGDGGCRRYFGAKGAARLRTHARRESYACQRESHSLRAATASAVHSILSLIAVPLQRCATIEIVERCVRRCCMLAQRAPYRTFRAVYAYARITS